jgi:hypothetical protein
MQLATQKMRNQALNQDNTGRYRENLRAIQVALGMLQTPL